MSATERFDTTSEQQIADDILDTDPLVDVSFHRCFCRFVVSARHEDSSLSILAVTRLVLVELTRFDLVLEHLAVDRNID